jgi:hypothetical protein
MSRLMPIILACVLLAGCSRQQHVRKHFVILVDTSASIEPAAEAECIKSIGTLVERMERGDTVSVIPITSDADVQSTGRILRLQKPTDRSAYNADLMLFSKHAQQSLQEMRAWAISHPTGETDIFGAIRMAAEEFAAAPKEQERILVIFSDFIEDDGTVDFKTDRRVAAAKTAIDYAKSEAKPGAIGARGKLGLLQSKELHGLNKQRREGIRRFWQQYLKSLGIESQYMTDGLGLLTGDL